MGGSVAVVPYIAALATMNIPRHIQSMNLSTIPTKSLLFEFFSAAGDLRSKRIELRRFVSHICISNRAMYCNEGKRQKCFIDLTRAK